MEPNYKYRDGNGEPTDEPSIRERVVEERALEEAVKPDTVSDVDRLAAENLALRSSLLSERKLRFVTEAQAQIDAMDRELMKVRGEMDTMRTTLTQKYGIDFKTQEIESGTGRIITVPTNRPNS